LLGVGSSYQPHLFSVTVSEKFDGSYVTDLLESVGENVDVNFGPKEFPADKQFIIW
jgi:hypothetical protein